MLPIKIPFKKEDVRQWMGKVQKGVQKIGKRNLILIGATILLGGAVYLNFVIFGTPSDPTETPTGLVLRYDAQTTGQEQTSPQPEYSKTENDTSEDAFFVSAILNRTRARDEAMEVLQMVIDNQENTAEMKSDAIRQITDMAAEIEAESNIETLIQSKGISECVAVISDGCCSVVVGTDSLLASELAQIQEIVYEQAGILPADLKIITK